VPGRNAEVCVLPKHFDVGRYFDKDNEVEAELCNIDVHKNAAVCPKLNSTNPGLDIYSPPQGGTPGQVEAAHCKIAGVHKIAKYKLSSSCSYTPSILGYYHVSRMLGGIGDVPPAVLPRSICKITFPCVARLWRRPSRAVLFIKPGQA
jgi:hypothetical protein